jgi:hypothetical protein
VSFTYSGAASGTFSAAGPPSGPGTIYSATSGQRLSGGLYKVDAFMPTNGALGNHLSLNVRPGQSGAQAVPVNDAACPPEPCATGFVGLGLYVTVPIYLGDVYSFKSGEVRLTEASGSRLRGTFRGTAIHNSTGAVIQVENGNFDVPVGH